MSAAALTLCATLLLQAAPAATDAAAPRPESVPLALERAGARVGDRVVVTATLPAAAGERIRFARPPDVDAAFARVEPTLTEATGRAPATLRLEMVAAAAGTFRVGPFELRVEKDASDAAGAGRSLATSALEVEVKPSWTSGRPAGFDEWRGPVVAPPVRSTSVWPWLAAAAAVVASALGWVALRRRADPLPATAPAPSSRPAWRDELERLAANVPEEPAARRRWWGDLSRVLREVLAHRARADSRDRTTEELSAGAPADDALRGELVLLLRAADGGKFTRAGADAGAASAAVTAALRLLAQAAAP